VSGRVSTEVKDIQPWGVNVPFIYLSSLLWALGGISLRWGLPYLDHPYLMILGAYSLYCGMIQRLFFPARKYLPLQLTSLILLPFPFHFFQVAAFGSLTITEVIALRDVKAYGSRFPWNFLVLLSPPSSAVAWFLFHGNYWILVPPLLLYVLGVNVGVFSANLSLRPLLGLSQLPVVVSVLLTWLFPKLLPITLAIYFSLLLYRRKERGIHSLTALLTGVSGVLVPFSSLYLGDLLHAFALGVMAPFFASCIVYSTSRYNYGRTWPIPLAFASSYFLRFHYLGVSWVPFALASLYFLFLARESLGFTALKYGMSKKYLEPRFGKRSNEKRPNEGGLH